MVFDGKRSAASGSDSVDVALGLVSGREALTVHGYGTFKLGTAAQVIRHSGGAYVHAIPGVVQVVSEGGEDSADGDGAQVVHVTGIDAAGAAIEADITVGGKSVAVFAHVHTAVVSRAGSHMVNVGDLRVSVSGTQAVVIPAGDGSSSDCVWMCPVTHTAAITGWSMCCASSKTNGSPVAATVDILLRCRLAGGLCRTLSRMSIPLGVGVQHMPFDPPAAIPAGTTVWASVCGVGGRRAPVIDTSAQLSVISEKTT